MQTYKQHPQINIYNNFKPIKHDTQYETIKHQPATYPYSTNPYTLQIHIISYSLKQSEACMRLLQRYFYLMPSRLYQDRHAISSYAALSHARIRTNKFHWSRAKS